MPEALQQKPFDPASLPARPVRLGHPKVVVERRPDGTIYVRPQGELAPWPRKLTERLLHWVEHAPDRIFLAQRDAAGQWRSITYRQTLDRVRRIGTALLARGVTVERPLVVLSGNDIEHALLELACLYIGVPYAPISPAYSLMSGDFGKLKQILTLLTPSIVFACDGAQYGRAIAHALTADMQLVVTAHPPAGHACTLFSELEATPASSAADAAHDKIGPDTIAKFLFTSGSTGIPKAVINTQRMWCANQVMLRTALAFFQDEPPVTLDWAPWHHTAGGNHDFGLILYNGGSLYIDEGKPLPGAIEATVRNLRDIAPTWYFNVPKGFEALLPYLREDEALRKNFFSRLRVLWFAGAAIAQHVLEGMQQLAYDTCGERILFLTSLGATETAPFAIVRTWDTVNAANIGLPGVGMELKLVPSDGKLEARVRGLNITPGYWRAPDLTAAAFDEEGFYKLGDALKFEDPNDPAKGLLFDGRVAEDFKLSTGTWVSVGPLRAKLIDRFAPYMRDVVIAGNDRNEIGVLVFPVIEACRALAPDLPADADTATVLADARVREKFHQTLTAFAKEATGSSNRVTRLILLEQPASLDAGEITDKGSLNQRTVLRHRATAVEELYRNPPSANVIAIA
jgi:feruloyl-CoA synthase